MLSTPQFLKVSISSCIFSLALLSGNAVARDFNVNLIATIDNGPAMEDVQWTIFRNDNETFKKANKHLARVRLPTGKYKAVARLKSDSQTIVRSRNFFVKNNTQVVIRMD